MVPRRACLACLATAALLCCWRAGLSFASHGSGRVGEVGSVLTSGRPATWGVQEAGWTFESAPAAEPSSTADFSGLLLGVFLGLVVGLSSASPASALVGANDQKRGFLFSRGDLDEVPVTTRLENLKSFKEKRVDFVEKDNFSLGIGQTGAKATQISDEVLREWQKRQLTTFAVEGKALGLRGSG